MKFIRLITQGPCEAYYNMALDEAISEAVRQKLSPPTLRLYQWDRPSLSLGYFQKFSDIDADYCTGKGYPVVRRQTGGRAILHDAELTYSFSASSESPFKGSLLENYTVISNALLHALEITGIKAEASFRKKRESGQKTPACFKAVSYGEITVNGKKLIGSAQKRYKDGFLQHGSILMSFDGGELSKILGLDSSITFNDIAAIKDYVPEITTADLIPALKEAFAHTLKVKLISDVPSKFELSTAEELERSKYSTNEWNHSR